MVAGIQTIIHPVTDLGKAKALYSALIGAPPQVDNPYYVGFSVAGQDIGLDPHGHSKGMAGPLGYWHVDDIEASLQALLTAGAEANQAITDVGAGKRIASVKDSDGNIIGILQSA